MKLMTWKKRAAIAVLTLLGLIGTAYAAIAVYTIVDAGTNTTPDLAVLSHNTTGTPAANYGAALKFRGQDSAKTAGGDDLARIRSYWSTATSGSEDSVIGFGVRAGGSALPAVGSDQITLDKNGLHGSVTTSAGTSYVAGGAWVHVMWRRAQLALGTDSIRCTLYDGLNPSTVRTPPSVSGSGSAGVDAANDGGYVMATGATNSSTASIDGPIYNSAFFRLISNGKTKNWYLADRSVVTTAIDAQTSAFVQMTGSGTAITLGVNGSVSTSFYSVIYASGVSLTSTIGVDTNPHDFETWHVAADSKVYLRVDNETALNGSDASVNMTSGAYNMRVANGSTAANRGFTVYNALLCMPVI